jgi:hypothetical protein
MCGEVIDIVKCRSSSRISAASKDRPRCPLLCAKVVEYGSNGLLRAVGYSRVRRKLVLLAKSASCRQRSRSKQQASS